MPQPKSRLYAPQLLGGSVPEHDGRVPGRGEVAVGAGVIRLAGGGGRGGVRCGGGGGGGGVVGVHGLLGAVEVGLESDAVGEVAEGRGAQHHDARPDRVLPRPAAAASHR